MTEFNNILDCINKRRSHRVYHDKNIPDTILRAILHAALQAPFGGPPRPKCQIFEAIIIRDVSTKENLALNYDDRQFIRFAPVVIACCANKNNDPHYKEWTISASLSIQNLITAAEHYNIGSCFITCFLHHENHDADKKNLRDILDLPEYVELVGLISLGYKIETEDIIDKTMRDYDEVIFYEKYNYKRDMQ